MEHIALQVRYLYSRTKSRLNFIRWVGWKMNLFQHKTFLSFKNCALKSWTKKNYRSFRTYTLCLSCNSSVSFAKSLLLKHYRGYLISHCGLWVRPLHVTVADIAGRVCTVPLFRLIKGIITVLLLVNVRKRTISFRINM